MKWFEKGDAGYILIIGLVILASAVFGGGFRQYNIHLDLNHTRTPEDLSIPGQTARRSTSTYASQSLTSSASGSLSGQLTSTPIPQSPR